MAPHPQSTEVTLQLDYWPDELSPAQKAAYARAEKEYNEVRSKLKDVIKESGGKNIFAGELFTAYQVIGPVPGLEQISQPITALAKRRLTSTPPPASPATPGTSKRLSSPGPDGSKRKSRRTEAPRDEPKLEPDGGEGSPDDDDEDYIPLAKRMKPRDKDKDKDKEPGSSKKVKEERKSGEKKLFDAKGKGKPQAPQSITASNARPTESSAVGGLQVGGDKEKKKITAEPSAIVDLTNDDGGKPIADSREVSFSKIQGKTFPSLVVIARPSLRISEKTPGDRPQLDMKVKNVLMHTPTKFTEWLIQQGLVKSEQLCQNHRGMALKLGMYSDVSKFPCSGGYVWISECCPSRFISVFNGSLFEGSPHPPAVLLKLIYHWACQTNVSNVVNWVKVDNLYVKGLYTWLRSICTVALSQHMKLLGGAGKKIEVGVISLGTTTQDGQQRQVKVEVLGVLDPEAKLVRLRAIEPLSDGERNYKKRFTKILEPLSGWVHKESIILTDLTVDKGTLNNMGYKTVQQVAPMDAANKNSNANIMDYLRRIVPRMFQNTLSLLSRQIIQQFLNELVWRESYGNTPGTAFDNIVLHIAEQTRIETKDNLLTRVNKAASDPFKHWTYPVESHTPPPKTPNKRGRKPKERPTVTPVVVEEPPPPPPLPQAPKKFLLKKLKKEEEKANSGSGSGSSTGGGNQKETSSNSSSNSSSSNSSIITVGSSGDGTDGGVAPGTTVASNGGSGAASSSSSGSNNSSASTSGTSSAVQKKSAKQQQEDRDDAIPLESYYYGVLESNALKDGAKPVNFNVTCPECPSTFRCNVEFQDHLFRHANPPPAGHFQCRYCLENWAHEDALQKHTVLIHSLETKNSIASTYNCLICEQRFGTVQMLTGHMQKTHLQCELPYRCAGCEYKSSSHHLTIDHFYKKHGKSGLVQCPFCLKMLLVCNASGPIVENVNEFMKHLRQHCIKSTMKKCGRCALTFLTRGALKMHGLFAHVVTNPATPGIKQLTKSVTHITKPRIKSVSQKELTSFKTVSSFEQLTIFMECGKVCLECGSDFDEDNHIIGMLECLKCPYKTACLTSMVGHTAGCNPNAAPDYTKMPLDVELHCVCGFSSTDGNALTRHMGMCERKTIYSTVELAQENIIKRNMLDMLGLVRRADEVGGEEGGSEQQQEQQQQQQHEEPQEQEQEQEQESAQEESAGASGSGDNSATTVTYDPAQSLYNIAGTGNDQQFNTQLSLDDLGPPSVLPAQEADCTPQLKDDYQSLATPRVPEQPDY